jgi:hypothetical protein
MGDKIDLAVATVASNAALARALDHQWHALGAGSCVASCTCDTVRSPEVDALKGYSQRQKDLIKLTLRNNPMAQTVRFTAK